MSNLTRTGKATRIDFNDVKGYATRANAIKKAEAVLSGYSEEVRYIIHLNENGRYIPVAVHYPNWALAGLVHSGICVV